MTRSVRLTLAMIPPVMGSSQGFRCSPRCAGLLLAGPPPLLFPLKFRRPPRKTTPTRTRANRPAWVGPLSPPYAEGVPLVYFWGVAGLEKLGDAGMGWHLIFLGMVRI